MSILSCAGVYCINTIRWSNDRPLPPHYGLRHSWTNAKKAGKVWIFSRKRGKIFKMSIFSDKDFAYIGEELDLLEVLRKD